MSWGWDSKRTIRVLGLDVEWRDYSSCGETGILLNYTDMYSSPPMNYKFLSQLGEFFGTEEIDVDDVAEGGCETCDYRSRYGYEIQVKNPTKNDPRNK